MPYRRNPNLLSSILSDSEVKSMILMDQQGVTKKQIADQFEVHRNTVRNVIDRAKESGLYYALDKG
jgi:transposase